MEGSEPSKSKRVMVRRAVRWAAAITGGAGVALLGLTAKGVGGHGSPTHATLGTVSTVLLVACAVAVGVMCIINMMAPPPATAVEQQLRQELRDHKAREAALRQEIAQNLAALAELTGTIEHLRAEGERDREAAAADRVRKDQLHQAERERIYQATGVILKRLDEMEARLVGDVGRELAKEIAQLRQAVKILTEGRPGIGLGPEVIDAARTIAHQLTYGAG